MVKDVMKVILEENLGNEDYSFMIKYKNSEFQVNLYEKKTKPIGICIDIPIVKLKPIGSPFH